MGHDPCADVHRQAADLVARGLHFAGVQPGPDADAQWLHCPRHGHGATDGARRAIECGKKAVSRCVDQHAAVLGEQGTADGMKLLQGLAPPLVAQTGRHVGRPHDVGEQHRGQPATGMLPGPFSDPVGDRKPAQRVDHVVGVTRIQHVVDPWQFQVDGIGHMVRQVAPIADTNHHISTPLDDQGRAADLRQHRAHVELVIGRDQLAHCAGRRRLPLKTGHPFAVVGVVSPAGRETTHRQGRAPAFPDRSQDPFQRRHVRVVGCLGETGHRAIQDQALDQRRIGCGEQASHGPTLGLREQDGPLRINCLHHGTYIVHAPLQGGYTFETVGHALAEFVEQDDPKVLAQAPHDRHVTVVAPAFLQVRHDAGNHHQILRTTAEHLERDAQPLGFGVTGFWRYKVAVHHQL